jgi:hypothetical protein
VHLRQILEMVERLALPLFRIEGVNEVFILFPRFSHTGTKSIPNVTIVEDA